MRTTQTQKSELTQHSHKKHKTINKIFLSCLVLILLILVVIYTMSRIPKTYKADVYSDPSLVVTTFQENKDEFHQISTLLLNNPQMFLEMEKNKHHTIIFDPYRLGVKYDKFISKEEYYSIVSFFEKFHPYEIKYCYGQYIYFVFLLPNSDGDNHGNSVVIYSFSPNLNDDRVSRLKTYLNQHGELLDLDSFWYYSIQ